MEIERVPSMCQISRYFCNYSAKKWLRLHLSSRKFINRGAGFFLLAGVIYIHMSKFSRLVQIRDRNAVERCNFSIARDVKMFNPGAAAKVQHAFTLYQLWIIHHVSRHGLATCPAKDPIQRFLHQPQPLFPAQLAPGIIRI